jgi:hypothetical protein
MPGNEWKADVNAIYFNQNENKMKIIILLIISLGLAGFLFGQSSVNYTYDDSGNRGSRVIIMDEKMADLPLSSPDSTFVKSAVTGESHLTKYQAKVGVQTINIFPNPTTELFTIKIEGWDNKTTALMNLSTSIGSSLIEKKLDGAFTEVNIKEQPQGTYLLVIILNGQKETWKVVKR